MTTDAASNNAANIDAASADAPLDLTLLIPVYNEEGAVGATLDAVEAALRAEDGLRWEIVCIDDGSTDASGDMLRAAEEAGRVRVVRHATNRGYGSALKAGARAARGRWLGMIDADGTYPADALPALLAEMRAGAAMAVGARTGESVHIPLARRPAKWLLRRLAEYLAEERIPDLNSGLRVVEAALFARYLRLLPNGFSLTTTITLALLTQGHDVRYVPIDYARRVGTSSIRPVRDTAKFAQLILRTVLYFNPLKIFLPVAAMLFVAAVGVAVGSKFLAGQLMDVTSIVLLVASFQLLAIGLLADLIDKRL